MPAPISEFTIGTGDLAVSFRILTNRPFDYSNGQAGPSRTVTYQIIGGRGSAAADALYGVGDYVLTTLAGSHYPKPHRFPNNTALSVIEVRGEPMGTKRPGAQLMEGTFEEISAHYAVNFYDVDGTEDATSGRAGIEVPWSNLAIRGEEGEASFNKNAILADGNRVASNVKTITVPDPTKEYIYSRGMMPNLIDFETALDPILGHVNDDAFFGYPAGTLLMGPWDTRIQMDASGSRKQEFTMSIKYRPPGWNSMPNPDNPRLWVPVTTVADGSSVIPSASFLPIIQHGVIV